MLPSLYKYYMCGRVRYHLKKLDMCKEGDTIPHITNAVYV